MDNSYSHSKQTGIRTGLVALCVAGAVLAAPAAQAVPFTSDLSIAGSVGYDNGYALGTQSGSLKVTQGTTASSSAFIDASGPATNPLAGALTDLGDGFGFTAMASATGADPANDTFGIGIDIGLNIANGSATDTYKITFNVDFNNQVDSAGADAFAHSNFGILDRASNQTLFFTDIFSDTVNGNLNGGQSIPGSGGPIVESGLASFAITLAAGQFINFDPSLHDLAWTLDGGAYSTDGTSSASLDLFLSIASVEKLTQPPQPPTPVPEPETLALFGLGLAGMGFLRRRRA